MLYRIGTQYTLNIPNEISFAQRVGNQLLLSTRWRWWFSARAKIFMRNNNNNILLYNRQPFGLCLQVVILNLSNNVKTNNCQTLQILLVKIILYNL